MAAGWLQLTHRAAAIMGGSTGALPSTPGHVYESCGDFQTSNHPLPTSACELLEMNPTGSHPEHSVTAEPQLSPPKKSPHKVPEVLQPQEMVGSLQLHSSLTGLGQLQLKEQVQVLLDQPLAQEEFNQVDGDLLPALGRGGFIQEGDEVNLAVLVGRSTTM